MLSEKSLEVLGKLPPILSVQDVTDFLSCSYLTTYRAIWTGELSAFKDEDGEWNILREDLRRYLSKRANL